MGERETKTGREKQPKRERERERQNDREIDRENERERYQCQMTTTRPRSHTDSPPNTREETCHDGGTGRHTQRTCERFNDEFLGS